MIASCHWWLVRAALTIPHLPVVIEQWLIDAADRLCR
jgi:hypothetical protein